MGGYFSLDEICSKDYFVLVDTCSFQASFQAFSNENSSPKEKLEKVIISNSNFSFWLNKIPFYKKIYSTKGVVDEIRNCGYNYKKSIKKPVSEKQNKRVILNLRRELSYNKRNKINLANLLESEGRIFKMSEEQKEIYNLFYEKYSFLTDKFNLSEVDLDLLLFGGVISRKNNTSIISNDHGIRDAWKFFLKREIFLGKGLYFYSNCCINLFKQERLNL